MSGVRRRAEMDYVSVQDPEEQRVEIGAAVELPAFVQAAVKAEDDPQETKVLVMPEWSPDEVDTSADGAADIAGFLPYRYNLSNPLGYEALLTVTVGEGAEEPEPGERDLNRCSGICDRTGRGCRYRRRDGCRDREF